MATKKKTNEQALQTTQKKPPKKSNVKGLFQFQYRPEILMEDELSNTKMATFLLAVESIRREADVNDINSLYECLNKYIALCGQSNMRITNLTAYEACGISSRTIDAWLSGQNRSSQPEYKEFAETLKGICRAYREQLGIEGKINPVSVIWWQKAHDGMREDTAVHVVEDEQKDFTAEEISKKYETL